MNFKYAFLNLCRKPVFTILTILQLVAACTLLYESYSYKTYYSSRTEKMIQAFQNKNLYYMKIIYGANFENTDKKIYENFSGYLKNSRDFKYISVFEDGGLYLNIGDKNGDFIMAYVPETIGNDRYQMVYNLDADSNFFKKFGFKVSTGRIFKDSDFNIGNNEPLPAILGNAYSAMYKIGDIIKSDINGKIQEIKVIGFLDKGYYFSTYGTSYLNNLDNYIITPQQPIVLQLSKDPDQMKTNEDIYKGQLSNYCSFGYIEINETNKSKFNQISDSIVSEAKKAGFTVKIVSLNDDVQSSINSARQQENSINMLFIVIFCFTSVGIITSVLYSISRQLKEFGVHIMQGAVLSDIARRILYEILILFVIAFIGTSIIAATIIKDNIIMIFNPYNLFIVFCIFIVLALLLSIIPVIKVLRLSINDLVRGKE